MFGIAVLCASPFRQSAHNVAMVDVPKQPRKLPRDIGSPSSRQRPFTLHVVVNAWGRPTIHRVLASPRFHGQDIPGPEPSTRKRGKPVINLHLTRDEDARRT